MAKSTSGDDEFPVCALRGVDVPWFVGGIGGFKFDLG